MSKFVIIADTHFTDKKEDAYRFGIFPYIRDLCSKFNYNTDLIIAGDLTEKKDNHSSTLVNKIIDELVACSNDFEHIYILKGNHDYVEEDSPFFYFLRHISGINYINYEVAYSNNIFFIPHKKNMYDNIILPPYTKLVIMHQTISGAKASNGKVLNGWMGSITGATNIPYILSGDIHTPQKVNGIEYIGSPYHVYFGDNFEGRILVWDDGTNEIEEYFPNFPKKRVVTLTKDSTVIETDKGDFVKFILEVPSSETYNIDEYINKFKTVCEIGGLIYSGTDVKIIGNNNSPTVIDCEKGMIDHEDVVKGYCNNNKIDTFTIDIGIRIINEVKKTDI